MRLDKYLKVTRIIKRRVIAKEAAQKERVAVNGKIVKPSHLLKLGDLVTLYFGLKTITIKVTSLVLLKNDLMYELISEEKVQT